MRLKILDRHLALALFGAAAMTALVLLGLTGFITFVEELERGQRHGIDAFGVLLLTALRMPELLFEMFPLVVLLGSILGLGGLAASGELVVMQAAGMSVWRIALAAATAGLILGLCSLLIGDRVVPMARGQAEMVKSGASGEGERYPALWLRHGQHFLHLGAVVSPRELLDLRQYELSEDGNEIVRVHQVGRANFREGRWWAEDHLEQSLTEDTLLRKHAQRTVFELGVEPELLQLFLLRADSLSLPGLRRYIDYLDANKLDAHRPRLEYWRKLAVPLGVVVMVLIAVPFVLGPLRDTGAGQRLFFGVLIGIAFYVVNETVASMGVVYRWPPFVAAFGPTLALGALAVWRLARR